MSVRILLLCGGMSAEHEVSLASARSVLEAAGDLQIVPLVIGKDGAPLSLADSSLALGLPSSSAPPALVQPQPAANEAPGPITLAHAATQADVVFPLLHGPFGEDGRVQGLLDLLGLPYVGSGVLGSAVAMDKLTMKAVFAAHGLPQGDYVPVTRHAWRSAPDGVIASLQHLAYPLFVKPANLGSSIGISRVQQSSDLAAALDLALRHDRRALVEQGVPDARELEVAVLGNDEPELSPVGEIRYQSGFYDYDSKYTDGAAQLLIPADVPPHVADRARALARRAFTAVDGAGLARVDFFWQEGSDVLLLNEINTMPGFTRHSMYPKLWQAAGVSYEQLIRRLVELALQAR